MVNDNSMMMKTTTTDHYEGRYEGRTRAADGWRWCSAHRGYAAPDQFHRNATEPDGLAHNCRLCVRAIRHATYLKRRETEIAAALAWQRAHPDATRATHRRADRVYARLHADQRRAADRKRRTLRQYGDPRKRVTP